MKRAVLIVSCLFALSGVFQTAGFGVEIALSSRPASSEWTGENSPMAPFEQDGSGPIVQPGDDVWIDLVVDVNESMRAVYLGVEWDPSWEFVDWAWGDLPDTLALREPDRESRVVLAAFDPSRDDRGIRIGAIRMIVGQEGSFLRIVPPPGEEGIVVAFGPYEDRVIPIDAARGIMSGGARSVRTDLAVNSHSLEVRCSPSPTRGSTSIVFENAKSGQAEVTIFDVSGRCVRNLVNWSSIDTHRTLTWDGRDDAGKPVEPGVYLFQAVSGKQTRSGKIVIVGK